MKYTQKRSLIVLFVFVITLPLVIFLVKNQQVFTQHAAYQPLTITSVTANNSSAKIDFQPVAGAADYRVYDVTNPNSVKYAGIVHLQAQGAYHYVQNSDGTPVFPFKTTVNTCNNYTLCTGQFDHCDCPLPEIEWNSLGDGMAHTLIVEAVDQVGPAPAYNGYVHTVGGDVTASNPNPQTMLGSNAGPTLDGKTSTNGQGPTTNTPQVIAQSQPFIVQANTSLQAIPSGSDALQTFYDTFANSEGTSITPSGTPTDRNVAYTLNNGDPTKGWTIQFANVQPSPSETMPFIKNDHFMDMLFDYQQTIWGAMNMMAQPTADISNGKMLHVTEEVDAHTDNRRALSFWFAPAGDPFTDLSEVDGNNQINTSGNALQVDLNLNTCRAFQFLHATKNEFWNEGESGATGLHCGQFPASAAWADNLLGRGLDNRSRIDIFLTSTHMALFVDGQLMQQGDIPTALPFSQVLVGMGSYLYHSDAEISELNNACATQANWYPYCESYWINTVPNSDERHWDNMGYEVLPASVVPGSNDFSALTVRIHMPTSQPPVFVVGSVSPTPTMGMNQPTPTPVTGTPSPTQPVPTGVPFSFYDDTTGNLAPGWVDCSQGYIHYTMGGMNGPGGGQYVLHTGVTTGNNLPDAFCSGGLSVVPYTTLDFYVMNGDIGPNIQLALTTAQGQSPAVPIAQYIQGGDTTLVLNKWEHVSIPLTAFGSQGSGTITKFSFIPMYPGDATHGAPSIFFDSINLLPSSSSLTPTPTPGPVTQGSWTNVTPAHVDLVDPLDCGNYGTTSMVADPNNQSTLYTQFYCQGIWKSTDYGQTWTGPINTGTNGSTAGDCAGEIAITKGASGAPPTLYESCIRGSIGFWKSTDGGVSWTNYPIAPAASNRQDVYAPSVDPYDGNHLIMAGHEQNLLVQSTDGGQTWTNIPMNPGMNQNGGTAYITFINTGNATTTRGTWLYMAQATGGTVGTWRTANGGSSWTKVDNGEHNHGAEQLYQNSSGVIFLPQVYSALGWGLLRSTDYGQTWTLVGTSGNLSTAFGTPNYVYADLGIGGFAPSLQLAPQPGSTGWVAGTDPTSMTTGPAKTATVFDGTHYVILSANWQSGLWRSVEPTTGTQPTPTPTPVPPTATLMPTNTPVPNSATLSLQLFLHDLGLAGDNVATNSGTPIVPLSKQRSVTIALLTTTDVQVGNAISGTVTYDTASGSFLGSISIPATVSPGTYVIKVTVPNYLSAFAPGFQTIQPNSTLQVPATYLVTGDVNNDNVLSILDYNILLACIPGNNFDPRVCTSAYQQASDLNDDGKVDEVDNNILDREMTTQKGQ